jgi:SHS2 domain-containing protein
MSGSGYELLPHTADVLLSVWAPTMEGCLVEAVRAMVAAFAEVREVRPVRMVGFTCDPAPAAELLVAVLEEAIYLIDTEDVVPVVVAVARGGEGGLVGQFGVADRGEVPIVGPAPKAVTRHGLGLAPAGECWRGEVVIDV